MNGPMPRGDVLEKKNSKGDTGEMNYIKYSKIRINMRPETVGGIISECVDLKSPLLVVRYGDGEAILVENKNQGRVDGIFKRQLNVVLNEKHVKVIQKNLIETLNESDILGVFDYTKSLPGYWGKGEKIIEKNCSIKTDIFALVDFPWTFLTGWEKKESYYDKLLKDLDDLYIISSRDLSTGFSKRFGVKKVVTLLIPPEMMFEQIKLRAIAHYPQRFYEIKDEIKALGDLHGKVMLYGAGIVGKIYGLWWKQAGGIAIDVGSVLDFFAGKQTRGQGCDCNSKDSRWKL